MNNKCPKCGFEYGEFDLYCARCGYKLDGSEKIVNEISEPDLSLNFDKHNNSKQEFFNSNIKFFTNSPAFFFVVSLLVVSLIFVGVMFFITKKHNMHKTELYYKNLMSNPAAIPELKEPRDYGELVQNLSDVENFLLVYLKYSSDSDDKKERIFTAFLTEIDKLPHITNENMTKDENSVCYAVNTTSKAKACANKLTHDFKQIGVAAFSEYNTVYLYPDYVFIKNKYSKYLSKSLKEYVNLKAKYNIPVGIGLDLYIKPSRLADKIYEFEKLYNSTQDVFVKEQTEQILYEDFRKFIFTPSIYATTTQEMKKEFKKAYLSYIKTRKDSSLRPVVMSYYDKKRSYDEENFKNDYPYKVFEDTFDDNIENNAFSDIFAQLRKSLFSKNSELMFAYVYSMKKRYWLKYNPQVKLEQDEFVISEPDENNNVLIYNSTFSLLQEINVSKYGKVFLVNGGLYVFNCDKLSVSRLMFNGKQFNLQNLSAQDVTSVFPGVEVINIDSYSNYNIYLTKDNKKATYIILSRYSQGYENYKLSALRGNISPSALPNMFVVNSVDDVLVAFHGVEINPDETSESSPTYKFVIRTRGESYSKSSEADFAVYDSKTEEEESYDNQKHIPQIMPKIPSNSDVEKELTKDALLAPPSQNIEPPSDND